MMNEFERMKVRAQAQPFTPLENFLRNGDAAVYIVPTRCECGCRSVMQEERKDPRILRKLGRVDELPEEERREDFIKDLIPELTGRQAALYTFGDSFSDITRITGAWIDSLGLRLEGRM